jgi:hypothetical protein
MGEGPALEPEFYDPADRDKLLVTSNVNGVRDMARDGNQAIIPERRNDENLIIIQLHQAIALFHNRLVDYVREQGIRREWVFESARRLTRWHYQWAVVHDFLPRFVGDDLVGPNGTSIERWQAGRRRSTSATTVRRTRPADRSCRSSSRWRRIVRAQHHPALLRHQPDHAGPRWRPDLRRRRRLQPQRRSPDPGRPGRGVEEHPARGSDFPARKPRSSTPDCRCRCPTCPGSVVPPPDPMVHLAVRNMLRGKRVGLPSGQKVAAAMGIKALSNATLGLSSDPGWGGQAPLWYYILKEPSCRRATPSGSVRWAAGSSPRSWSGSSSGTRTPTCTWTRPGSPPRPLRRRPGQFGFVDLLRFAGAA